MGAKNILLLDIGNTNTKVGVADESGLAEAYVLPTDAFGTADALGFRLREILDRQNLSEGDISAVAACSVVPSVSSLLRQASTRFFGCQALFAPEDLPLAIENRYARPKEVGADRLTAAFAARSLNPAKNLIIIDFGTATTFDVVSENAYLGGLICPGLLSSAKGLATLTAKLPQITLEIDSQELEIGRSTAQSLNQGLIFGFAAMAEGLCGRLKEVLGGDASVIATGGFAENIAQVCRGIDMVRPDLLLEGLRLVYYKGM